MMEMSIPDAFAQAIRHYRSGNFEGAENICKAILQASQLDKEVFEALRMLGAIMHQQARYEEAKVHLEKAIVLEPNNPELYNNLSEISNKLEKPLEAEKAARQAISILPDYAGAENNLGNALKEQNRLDEAADAYCRSLEICPNDANFQSNLGDVFGIQGMLDEAVMAYRKALAIQPDHVKSLNNLGNVLKDQGRVREAIQAYQRLLKIQPDFSMGHCNLVYIQNFLPDVTLSSLTESHAQWDRRHAAPLKSAWRPFGNSRDPDRKIRLGFVSNNFGRHPCGYFSIRALEALDTESFETVFYSDSVNQDDMTDRFIATAGTWRQVQGLSDEVLADRIREDGIDILIGMFGLSFGNRFLMLARKPAPIQMSWAGYPGSTGLSAIDYLIADRFHVPQELEGKYREKILRLPDGYVCYEPPDYAPQVGPLPFEKNGYITFGSFNQAPKYNSDVVKVWSRILDRLADSRLVLKFRGLVDQSTRRYFQDLFADRGIDPSRLELQGTSPHSELMAEYGRIDITLDPFPFSGGLTTCESIWMGVPVIIWQGETFASRHSLSHLSNAGLTETIARDLSEYVDIAVGLANDLPRLAKLRAGLRERMARSPLCDGKRFAENLMKALRGVWREWCCGTPN